MSRLHGTRPQHAVRAMSVIAPLSLKGRRFARHVEVGRPSVLAKDHPSAVEARTRYKATVREPSSAQFILKSGQNSPKIDGRILKGRWAGMPAFTLTLEERATCPSTCLHWFDCYGNKMHWPHRFKHGAGLEARLLGELEALNVAHPNGFVVRLHVLGDFYSVAYVSKWRLWLSMFPALNVYGYTAWPVATPIGRQVQRLRDENWQRFSVRTSDGGLHDASTVSAHDCDDPLAELGTICPAQTQDTDCCATCGLCWQSRDNIVFLEH